MQEPAARKNLHVERDLPQSREDLGERFRRPRGAARARGFHVVFERRGAAHGATDFAIQIHAQLEAAASLAKGHADRICGGGRIHVHDANIQRGLSEAVDGAGCLLLRERRFLQIERNGVAGAEAEDTVPAGLFRRGVAGQGSHAPIRKAHAGGVELNQSIAGGNYNLTLTG